MNAALRIRRLQLLARRIHRIEPRLRQHRIGVGDEDRIHVARLDHQLGDLRSVDHHQRRLVRARRIRLHDRRLARDLRTTGCDRRAECPPPSAGIRDAPTPPARTGHRAWPLPRGYPATPIHPKTRCAYAGPPPGQSAHPPASETRSSAPLRQWRRHGRRRRRSQQAENQKRRHELAHGTLHHLPPCMPRPDNRWMTLPQRPACNLA